MPITFPASPNTNDTHTEGSITYKWDGDKWIGMGLTPSDRLVEGSNKLELNANNDIIYTGTGTLKVNSEDASDYIAEFNQVHPNNSAQILINSPSDGESRPVLLNMARAGTLQWSLGQGYLDTNDSFHISTSNLSGGFADAKLTITPDNKVGIGTNNPVSALDVRNASETDPLLSLHHSEADVIGEVVRIGRVAPYHTIRYHSIKAEHSGGAGSNFLGFNIHNGSDSTSQTEVLKLIGNGEASFSHGISYGPNSSHSNDEVMRMHMYSDSTTINDGVTFKVTLTFANANIGPFMIELFQAHPHYPGTPSYCKVIGAYGASDATGGVSSHIVENSGNIGSLTIANNSDSTQRGNNSDWTFSIQGTSASSNVGTSLKCMTYVIVHSRTIPGGCTFEEV